MGDACDNHLSHLCLLARSSESCRSFSFERRSFIVERSVGLDRVGIGGVETEREGVKGVGSRIGTIVSVDEGSVVATSMGKISFARGDVGRASTGDGDWGFISVITTEA